MKRKHFCLPFLFWFLSMPLLSHAESSRSSSVDVLVVGGGASGVTAALQSARMGMRVLIVEETAWLGGMLTSAGVSAIDGNERLPAGLWGEFRGKLADHYGGLDKLVTGWVSNVLFEPSVGNHVLHKMVAKEKSLTLWKSATLKQVFRKNGYWYAKIKHAGRGSREVVAKVLIDATELGDVAKMCGVGYDIGMESRDVTHETVAPMRTNGIVQDITYVATLKDYGKDMTIKRPKGYNPNEFACACINTMCVNPKEPERMWSKEKMITYGQLPNNKYMINWPIAGNDYYVNLVEMTPKQRTKALKAAKQYTLNFVYFIQHELGFNHLGLADDEYPTKDLLPMIPYHRESRRIHGLVRFTLNHVTAPYTQSEKLYRTCVAVGDYPVDHHHLRYQGSEALPNLYFHPVPSFGLPLGTLIPQQAEGLIVAEKSISVSNIINGSTRLQPVVMQIGQAAGALAALAVRQQKPIAEVSVRDVQNVILESNGYLLPFLDVPLSDKRFKAYQRIGATGILKGVGKSVEWKNQTWLRADTVLLQSDLEGMKDVYPVWSANHISLTQHTVTVDEAIEMIRDIAEKEQIRIMKQPLDVWKEFDLGVFDGKRSILRGEMAVLLDQTLDPFNHKLVDIHGRFVKQ